MKPEKLGFPELANLYIPSTNVNTVSKDQSRSIRVYPPLYLNMEAADKLSDINYWPRTEEKSYQIVHP